MDVENPNEFLEEKKSRKDKKAEVAKPKEADKPGAGRNRDAEDTRSANPAVRKGGGSDAAAAVRRGGS